MEAEMNTIVWLSAIGSLVVGLMACTPSDDGMIADEQIATIAPSDTDIPPVPTDSDGLATVKFLYDILGVGVTTDVVDLTTGLSVGKTGLPVEVRLAKEVSYGIGTVVQTTGTAPVAWSTDGLPLYHSSDFDWVTPPAYQAELAPGLGVEIARSGNKYFFYPYIQCFIGFYHVATQDDDWGAELDTAQENAFDLTVEGGEKVVAKVTVDEHIESLIVVGDKLITTREGFEIWGSWILGEEMHFEVKDVDPPTNLELMVYDCVLQ